MPLQGASKRQYSIILGILIARHWEGLWFMEWDHTWTRPRIHYAHSYSGTRALPLFSESEGRLTSLWANEAGLSQNKLLHEGCKFLVAH